MAVLQNKKEIIEGFINNISDYYQYHKLRYIYHIEDNDKCGCDILDLKDNQEYFKKDDLLYLDKNEDINNKLIELKEIEYKENNQENLINPNNPNNPTNQAGGQTGIEGNGKSNEKQSSTNEIIFYTKIPKEPSSQYTNELNQIIIQKYQNFDVIGTQYNFGTNSKPIFANVPSNNPKISANVVTNNFTMIEENDTQNGGQKDQKKPLIIDVDAQYIKGPINNLFEYYEETNIEKYNSFIGSASLFDTQLKINCIDPNKSKLESQTEKCKDRVEKYKLEEPCNNTIPYDGIINIACKKKSTFRSFLTKIIFLGVDYKKLFLERYKFSPPDLKDPEDSDDGKKSKSYAKYLNNLIVGMIFGTIAIDNISTYIAKHYTYIPPNAGVLTKALSSSREYLYNGSKTLSNVLPSILFTFLTIIGWFVVKGILNTVLSPYITKEITTNLEGVGDCNLAAIAAPFLGPENKEASSRIVNAEAVPIANARIATKNNGITENNEKLQEAKVVGQQYGGKKKNYIIRIGKNNNKYYENQFYEFYKFNDVKQKYQKIKNLYINPVLKQLRAKSKVYSYDDNVLEKLIQSL